MDVKVFKTFLEIAREKHFGRAASNLYITQAAASARIKQLEVFYGAQLFTRDRNAIKLTSTGERLLPYGELIVQTLEQSKSALALAEEHAIQLTLAGTANTWDAYLQQALGKITQAFSGYAFKAETYSRDQIIRGLMERTLDLGVSFDPIKSDEIYCVKIAEPELVLASSKAMDAEQALSQNYVYVDWGTRFALEHAERHHRAPPPYLRTSTGRIALEFILQQGGAAYLPQSMAEPFIESGQLELIPGQREWPRAIYLSYRKNSANLESLQKIENLLMQTEAEPAFLLQQASES